MTKTLFPVGLLSVLALSLTGCEEKKPNLAPAASSLAASPPPPPSVSVKTFLVDSDSQTSLSLEAPKERIKAKTTAAAGQLNVDLSDLTKSRGEIKIDLTTLTTSTFESASDNATQTGHARTWLEVADGESGKLDEALKAQHRFAVYAIRAIEGASAADLRTVAPIRENGEDVRAVTLTTKGELLVHGHKVMRDAEVEVRFYGPAGASADGARRLSIVTKKPFRVVLAEHAVQPRDPFGKLATKSFHLLGTKVADNAEIALDLRARSN